MRAAVISLGSESSKMTAKEMEKYFDEVDMISLRKIEVELGRDLHILYKGKPLEHYDCLYAKGSFRYSQILKTITSLKDDNTFVPYDPNAYLIVHDKFLTQVELQKYNIPMPQTYLSPTVQHAKEMLKNVNYPIVMKFPSGTQGKGVMFGDSYSSAISILDALTALKQPFIIQEYIETGGKDVRAFVVGDKVVAAMERVSNTEDKRANIHAGGSGNSIELTLETKQIALKVAKALGLGIGGVDILQFNNKSLVIEANISPGLQGITNATGINVADKIAKYLYDSTIKHQKKSEKKKAKKLMQSEGLMESSNGFRQIISTLDIRGSRILLPDLVEKIAEFNDSEEVSIEIGKKEVHIKKF